MTQTIEQLTARVRELEEENARLGFALADTEALELGTSERLAASQAYAEQLRETFKTVATGYEIGSAVSANNDHTIKLHYVDQQQMEDAFDALILQLDKALALPRDTSALDAYVAEKVKEAGR